MTRRIYAGSWTAGWPLGDARAALPVDPAVIRRRLRAVGLRNILVHDYLDVGHGRLFDELGWIDDAVAFAAAIERWIETLEGSPGT